MFVSESNTKKLKESHITKFQAQTPDFDFLKNGGKGPLAQIAQISKKEKLNKGKGYTPDYVRKVLVYKSRNCPEIVELARRYQAAIDNMNQAAVAV